MKRNMLTPAFELSQEDEFLILTIKTPYAKVSDTEIFIDGCDFRFHSKPYFLRLALPAPLVEDGREKAKYDADSGSFTVRVPKANAGEYFEGLDMLTTLLAPKGSREVEQATVEVLGEDPSADHGQQANEEGEEEFDWQIEQTPYTEDTLLDGPTYGFANQKSGVFKRLQDEFCGVIDLAGADEVPPGKRPALRDRQERDVFDDEHYMADLCDEDGTVEDLINYSPQWNEEYKQLMEGQELVCLDEEEKEVMRKLPRKEYLMDSATQQQVYLGLVDILFAYAYNHRTTEGENTVESAWTICKLSGTLAWLQVYSCLREAVTCCYRSCLCYPLYRHWRLCEAVQQDVVHILKLGRRKVLKCFLEIRQLLSASDMRYILNDLYITDYCVWIQSTSKKTIKSLADNLENVKVNKDDIGFDLPILERACILAAQEASESDEISNSVSAPEKSELSNNCEANFRNSASKSAVGTRLRQSGQSSVLASSSDSEESSSCSSDYTSGTDSEFEESDQSHDLGESCGLTSDVTWNEPCAARKQKAEDNPSDLSAIKPKSKELPSELFGGEVNILDSTQGQTDHLEEGIKTLSLQAAKQTGNFTTNKDQNCDPSSEQDLLCKSKETKTDSKSLNF